VSKEDKKNGNGSDKTAETKVFTIPDPAREFRLDPVTINGIQKLAYIFERMNLSEYISIMQDKRKIIFNNFIAGLARGFGFSIGMTVLLGVLVYVLSHMVDLPLISKYIAHIVQIVQEEVKMRKF